MLTLRYHKLTCITSRCSSYNKTTSSSPYRKQTVADNSVAETRQLLRSSSASTSISIAWRLRRRISTVMLTCGWAWPARLPIRPIWAFGEQSSQKCAISCLERRWTAVQNLTPLALSSAEKSAVTVQTNKQIHTNKQTVNDISTPCLSACVDNKALTHDSIGTLALWCERSRRNSDGITPNWNAKCRWSWSRSLRLRRLTAENLCSSAMVVRVHDGALAEK